MVKTLCFAIRLVVENMTGTLFQVELENDATFGDLKRKIEAEQNLPLHRMFFVLDSDHELPRIVINKDNENSSLVDFRVQDGSHIYLFFTSIHHDDDLDLDPPNMDNENNDQENTNMDNNHKDSSNMNNNEDDDFFGF